MTTSSSDLANATPGAVTTRSRWALGGRGWWLALGFLLVYLLADEVNLFPHPRFNVQPWNLHPALGVALIAYAGPAYVPVLLIAVLTASWLLPGGTVGFESGLAAFAITGIYWAAGRGLHRWARWCSSDVRPRDVNVLLAVCLAAAVSGAAIEALRQAATSDLPAAQWALLSWRRFVADLLGLVVLTPALLQWSAGVGRATLARFRGVVVLRDLSIFAATLVGALLLIFGLQLLDEFRASYLLFLPVIAMAMRYGLFGVASLVPVVQLALLGALTLVGSRAGTAFEFQLLMLTLAISALYLGSLTDERRRAAERIAEHERALRERGHALAEAQRIASTAELAAALAHDLSQPLSAMGTYARASQVLAQRGDGDHERLLETLEHIASESTRAGNYLRRMREFFRTGAMRSETVEVAGLCGNIHAHLRDRLVLGEIQWQLSLEPGLPPIRADAVQVGAILGNLVANACDALEGKPGWRQIHVKAYRTISAEGPMVRIAVEDTGAGVPEEVRDRLFSPLATSKPQGMGLGLALSRSIAERQGGRLWFDAGAAQTTFCLDLPAAG